MQSSIFKDLFQQKNRREIFRSGRIWKIVIDEDSTQ